MLTSVLNPDSTGSMCPETNPDSKSGSGSRNFKIKQLDVLCGWLEASSISFKVLHEGPKKKYTKILDQGYGSASQFNNEPWSGFIEQNTYPQPLRITANQCSGLRIQMRWICNCWSPASVAGSRSLLFNQNFKKNILEKNSIFHMK